MPVFSVTTTVRDVFAGDTNLTSITFKNVSSAGEIFVRYKPFSAAAVSSTDFEISLKPSEAVSFTIANDGDGIVGPWSAVSDTGGGVSLAVTPIYLGAVKGS